MPAIRRQFALKTKGNPIGVAEDPLQPKLPADIKGQPPPPNNSPTL